MNTPPIEQKDLLYTSQNHSSVTIFLNNPRYRPATPKYKKSIQESFYLQGILNDINEQDTFFLECKHKQMMKRGAPPDKV